MINFFRSKLYKMLLVSVLIYTVYVFYNQQVKLNAYANEKQYYEGQIEDLKKEKEALLVKKENVNSPEYIEEMAREKLDMYLPNERVYVDIGK